MKHRVLLVEDNQDMRNSLADFLSEDGFLVTALSSTEDGIDAVDEKQFDIALIDINLPGKSGFSLIEYIRENGHTFPLIAMTARDSIADKIKGFDLGLTDYIVKPFDLLELRARLKVHSKAKKTTETVSTDNFLINTSSYEFMAYGKRVEVTQLELRILKKLIENNHTLVTLDDIIEYAWGDSADITTPPIRIHIANIRKKIGDHSYKIIRTVPGVGYIFNDPLREEER